MRLKNLAIFFSCVLIISISLLSAVVKPVYCGYLRTHANGYGHGAYGSSYDFHAGRKGRGHRYGGGMVVDSGK